MVIVDFRNLIFRMAIKEFRMASDLVKRIFQIVYLIIIAYVIYQVIRAVIGGT